MILMVVPTSLSQIFFFNSNGKQKSYTVERAQSNLFLRNCVLYKELQDFVRDSNMDMLANYPRLLVCPFSSLGTVELSDESVILAKKLNMK